MVPRNSSASKEGTENTVVLSLPGVHEGALFLVRAFRKNITLPRVGAHGGCFQDLESIQSELRSGWEGE